MVQPCMLGAPGWVIPPLPPPMEERLKFANTKTAPKHPQGCNDERVTQTKARTNEPNAACTRILSKRRWTVYLRTANECSSRRNATLMPPHVFVLKGSNRKRCPQLFGVPLHSYSYPYTGVNAGVNGGQIPVIKPRQSHTGRQERALAECAPASALLSCPARRWRWRSRWPRRCGRFLRRARRG